MAERSEADWAADQKLEVHLKRKLLLITETLRRIGLEAPEMHESSKEHGAPTITHALQSPNKGDVLQKIFNRSFQLVWTAIPIVRPGAHLGVVLFSLSFPETPFSTNGSEIGVLYETSTDLWTSHLTLCVAPRYRWSRDLHDLALALFGPGCFKRSVPLSKAQVITAITRIGEYALPHCK